MYNNPIKILYAHRIIDSTDEFYPFLRELGNFDSREFEEKIKYLARHYKFISLKECIKYLTKDRRPANCVVLTFDDGYKSIYTKVFPILRRYNIPATVFITAGFIGDNKMIWHDKLTLLIAKTQVKEFSIPELSGRVYKVRMLHERKQSYEDINKLLKKIENNKKEDILDKMFDYLQLGRADLANNNLMLSWHEIDEMHKSGLISFGSHTMSHPILTMVSLEQAKYEIQQSAKIIEENLREPVRFFSYPNGDYNDFNEDIKDLVKKSGYLCGCSTVDKFNNGGMDLFALCRNGFISEPFFWFGIKMAGIFDFVSLIKTNSNSMKIINLFKKYFDKDEDV
jgi:peptidoglycan/xylan/chitin deacetylase (PgdA/CDA1 family)